MTLDDFYDDADVRHWEAVIRGVPFGATELWWSYRFTDFIKSKLLGLRCRELIALRTVAARRGRAAEFDAMRNQMR